MCWIDHASDAPAPIDDARWKQNDIFLSA